MWDYVFLFMIAAFCTAVLARLIAYKVKPAGAQAHADWPRDDNLADVQPSKPNITFERIKRQEAMGRRQFGQRTTPPTKKPTIFLSPRMIERVNIQRKLRGKPPLNRDGIKNAIAHPATVADARQPQTSSDWLTYLIMYEVFFADHQSHTVSGCGGITVDPNVPYNGQGGAFAGAGASGDWTSAPASVTSAVAAVAPTDIYAGVAAAVVSNDNPVSNSSPSYSSGPDSAPSYTPDPTPSYTSDPTPSYSSPDTGGGGFSGGGDGT